MNTPVWQHLLVGVVAVAPLLLCGLVALVWARRRTHQVVPLERTRAQYATAARRRSINDRRVRRRLGLS